MTGEQIKVDDFSNNNLSNLHETILRSSFFFSLNTCSSRLVSSIIRLLDDSVESLTALNSQFVKFKRFNEKEEILAREDLMKILSAGTFRVVELYIRCIDALKYGKTIIIGEIETSFQKNLVYKLLFLFNDGEINSKGPKLYLVPIMSKFSITYPGETISTSLIKTMSELWLITYIWTTRHGQSC